HAHRAGDGRGTRGHHRRGGAVVPGPGGPAADPVAGHHAGQCPAVLPGRTVDGGVPWRGDRRAHARAEPVRRRPARRLRPAGEPTVTLLSVADLTVRFRTEDGPVLAVDAASFDLAAEEVLALVGESGCGKSVTALALTRLLPRNATVAGTVTFDGTELLTQPESALRDV